MNDFTIESSNHWNVWFNDFIVEWIEINDFRIESFHDLMIS